MAEMPNETSSLCHIDETIEKSRQIVQQSKDLTLKNAQRKAMLEERYRTLISPGGETIQTPPTNASPRLNIVSANQFAPSSPDREILLENSQMKKEVFLLKQELENVEFYRKKERERAEELDLLVGQLKKEDTGKAKHIEKLERVVETLGYENSTLRRAKGETENAFAQEVNSLSKQLNEQLALNKALERELPNYPPEATDLSRKLLEFEEKLFKNSTRFKTLEKRLGKTETLLKKPSNSTTQLKPKKLKKSRTSVKGTKLN